MLVKEQGGGGGGEERKKKSAMFFCVSQSETRIYLVVGML